MSNGELEEARDFWNRIVDDWLIQVGDDGDGNRRLHSDPVCGNSQATSVGHRARHRLRHRVFVKKAP